MNSSHLPLPSELIEQTLQEPAKSFDYTLLDTETRIVVQQRTSEIKEQLRNAAQATCEVGQKLVDVRNRLEYGQFNQWLKIEFQWSRSTAYNYINVFESFSSCPNFGQLDIAISALYLLAAPSTPVAAREEALERALEGEIITSAKAKKITNSYKAGVNISEPVTVNISAETVEKLELTQAETIHYTEQNQLPIHEEASTVEVVKNLMDLSIPTVQISKINGSLTIENEKEKQVEQQYNYISELYKNLTTNITYLAQEEIFELIDIFTLKSLMNEITVLIKRKEASLNKQYNSNHFTN